MAMELARLETSLKKMGSGSLSLSDVAGGPRTRGCADGQAYAVSLVFLSATEAQIVFFPLGCASLQGKMLRTLFPDLLHQALSVQTLSDWKC